jgi:hypothetical protein
MANVTQFPTQTILQIEKTPEWCSLHLDYATQKWRANNNLREKMDADFLSYNGVKGSIRHLEETYGKKNRAKLIAYRAHKPKIQLMVGEFLTQPLAATVETTNRDAKSEKMRQMDFMMGAMIAKKEIMELKEKAGVDIMEGAPIPESEDDPIWAKMSPKDKEEATMQVILNEMIKSDDIKIKFSDDVLNGTITSVMFGKVERNEEGETTYISIDPRDAIFEEIKGDLFLEKSPILGSCIYMSIPDVLRRFKLTKTQIDLINSIGRNPSNYTHTSGVKIVGGNLMIQVMHIEWKSVIPTYFKRLTKTASQLELSKLVDDSEPFFDVPFESASAYEENKKWHDAQEAKGKYKIVVKYAEDLWEATRIGGMKELDVNMRRALFQMRKVDDPTRIFGSSYTGFLCQTKDGKRISLMNELENWSNIFDITMYKILQDINKFRGNVLGYNAAGLPAKSTVKEVNYNIVNDGFITYDTSASGNFHGRDVSLSSILEVKDLGLSSSFPSLIQFKNDILMMMERMTGINENREGQISASATVTNTDSAIAASRTITAPFFYGVHLYISKVLEKIVESTKITWAFYKIEKGEQILGASKFKWLQVTQELGFKDYGVHIQEGSKYAQVKQFMQGLMEASLNAKEISQADALSFMLSETFADQKAILENAESKVREFQAEQQQAQLQAQAQNQDKNIQMQLELAREDREDRQKASMDEIEWKATNQIRIDNNNGQNKVVEQDHKAAVDRLGEV